MQHYSAKHQAQKTVSLTLQPSNLLAFFYSLVGFFACFCLMFLPLSLRVIGVICFFVLTITAYTIMLQAILILPWSLNHLELNIKGKWSVTNKKGDNVPVSLHSSTFVAGYLAVINIHEIEKKRLHSMVIIPQRVQQDTFRKLRVLLLWGKTNKAEQKDDLKQLFE